MRSPPEPEQDAPTGPLEPAPAALAADWSPRPPVAQELLQLYSDPLRAGRVRLNGEELCWDTGEGTERQLIKFCAAFCSGLRRRPELRNLSDAVVREASYWFCKAVAIRYMPIIDVMQKVSATSLATYSADGVGVMVDYSAEVGPGHIMRVALSFHGEGNLVHVDPETGDTSVRGTIASLRTEFGLPPERKFVPEYILQLRLARAATSLSLVERAWQASCGIREVSRRESSRDGREARRVLPSDTIDKDGAITVIPSGPLSSEYPLCTFTALLAAPPPADRRRRGTLGSCGGERSSLVLQRPPRLPGARIRCSSTPSSPSSRAADAADGGDAAGPQSPIAPPPPPCRSAPAGAVAASSADDARLAAVAERRAWAEAPAKGSKSMQTCGFWRARPHSAMARRQVRTPESEGRSGSRPRGIPARPRE